MTLNERMGLMASGILRCLSILKTRRQKEHADGRIERVKIRGDILIGKVYGYTDSYSGSQARFCCPILRGRALARFGRNQKK